MPRPTPKYKKTRYDGVIKRGKVYYIRYEAPANNDGTRCQKMKSCKGMDIEEARIERAKIVTQIARNEYIDTTSTTVSEYLDRFLAHCQTLKTIATSTYVGYERCARRYAKPFFGAKKLTKLKTIDIQQLYEHMIQDLKLSPKTVHNTHGFLHTAFNQAVSWQLIYKNPADGVMLPELDMPDTVIATDDEWYALRDAIQHSEFEMPIIIAMTTALRRGEICGLKWEDVDAERCRLFVRRSISQTPGDISEKTTKTRRSRSVKMPPTLLKRLVDYRDNGHIKHEDGWICTHSDGRPITPDSLSAGYDAIKDKLKMNVTLHGLRHTQITELILAGINIKAVSERAGHAKSGITLDRYTHTLPDLQDGAADYVENKLTKKRPKKKKS